MEVGTLLLIFSAEGYQRAVVIEDFDNRFMVKLKNGGEKSYLKDSSSAYKYEVLTKNNAPLKSGKTIFGGWTFKEEIKKC